MMTWEDLVAIHAALPEPKPVVLKLYHDSNGQPIVYTTEDLDGNYIEVDPETFALGSVHVKVVNGVLTHLPPRVYRNRLVPSDQGTQCDPRDVAVVVNSHGQHWKRKTYED